jgi:succinyl-diaminopimelate desuccinylase
MSKDAIISLSSSLIEIPSVKGKADSMKAVLDCAARELEGFTVEWFEDKDIPSLLAYAGDVRPDRFKFIFNAHLDVVPAKDEQFKVVVNDNKLVGRGAYDMKAAGAVEILVFKELAKQLPFPIGLQLVTDEEVGGFSGTKFQIEQGVRADFVIAGEPTDMDVNNKAKGIVWLKVKTHGVSAHGAYPWRGENAILKMNGFVAKLCEVFPVPTEEVWKTTVNVARIENSNQAFNTVPDDCVVSLDIRYIPEDKDSLIPAIEALLPVGAEIEVIMKEPSQSTEESNVYVKKIQACVKEVSNYESQVIVKHGGADIRHFNAVGCEGVTFGPKGAGLHGDYEWVDIESLVHYSDVLKKFLLEQ